MIVEWAQASGFGSAKAWKASNDRSDIKLGADRAVACRCSLGRRCFRRGRRFAGWSVDSFEVSKETAICVFMVPQAARQEAQVHGSSTFSTPWFLLHGFDTSVDGEEQFGLLQSWSLSDR